MGTHVIEMSAAEQGKALETARELAVEFDRVGPEADANNAFPTELIQLFKDSGLVALNVSKEFGGLGGDIWTTTRVATELAKGDAACALGFNMHYVMVGIFGGLLNDETRKLWLPQVGVDHKIVCGPFSEEKGLLALADTTAVPTAGGGWKVSGKKTWGTLSPAADIISFNATITDEDGVLPSDFMDHASRESVFIVPMDTPGISIKETWDAMGMRATGTHTVVFDNAEIPYEARVGDFRGGLFAHFEWPAMTFAGVYYGLALRAYDEAKAALRKMTLGHTQMSAETALKDLGYVQHGLGEMWVKNETTLRVIESTCRTLLDGRDAEWHPMTRVHMLEVAKVVATESAIEVAGSAMRLVGGSSYRRGHVLERLYRDSRSGPFHPPTTDQAYDFLGKFDLGFFDPPPAG